MVCPSSDCPPFQFCPLFLHAFSLSPLRPRLPSPSLGTFGPLAHEPAHGHDHGHGGKAARNVFLHELRRTCGCCCFVRAVHMPHGRVICACIVCVCVCVCMYGQQPCSQQPHTPNHQNESTLSRLISRLIEIGNLQQKDTHTLHTHTQTTNQNPKLQITKQGYFKLKFAIGKWQLASCIQAGLVGMGVCGCAMCRSTGSW